MKPIEILNQDQRRQAGLESLKANPDLQTVHVTTDGQAFADERWAMSHARDLARGHADRAAQITEVTAVHRTAAEAPTPTPKVDPGAKKAKADPGAKKAKADPKPKKEGGQPADPKGDEGSGEPPSDPKA